MKKEPNQYRLTVSKMPRPEDYEGREPRIMDYPRGLREDRQIMEEMDLTAEEAIFVMSKLAEVRGNRDRRDRRE